MKLVIVAVAMKTIVRRGGGIEEQAFGGVLILLDAMDSILWSITAPLLRDFKSSAEKQL